MVNISDRWNRDKTDDLQFAFFNGVGWESWENIWGIWNGITPRDAEATRRVGTLECGIAPFLISADWEPFFPTLHFGMFASRWPLDKDVVWTIVNRNEYSVAGPQMELPVEDGTHYIDLYHGVELNPELRGNKAILTFGVESKGYGTVLATKSDPSPSIRALMDKMSTITVKPLKISHEWTFLPQQLVEIPATKPPSGVPAKMVKIPAGKFVFRVKGIEIEGSDDVGVDVQYPWEDSPRRFHEHSMQLDSFWIDEFPVTNEEFKGFLDATHYQPKDDLNFLCDWVNGDYPSGTADRPVTWVSLEDARAFASWAGKRLPHEWEWQYAAQGSDGRSFPWGNEWDSSAVPVPDTGRTMRGPDRVTAHPKGASPFGVMDLVGNVWQWTDEIVDDHTRAAVVRGGSYYQPQGSNWYFPQAYNLAEHGKLLLMAPSKDRFRSPGISLCSGRSLGIGMT
jgi:iron(II)-dependent oxidoreductase